MSKKHKKWKKKEKKKAQLLMNNAKPINHVLNNLTQTMFNNSGNRNNFQQLQLHQWNKIFNLNVISTLTPITQMIIIKLSQLLMENLKLFKKKTIVCKSKFGVKREVEFLK